MRDEISRDAQTLFEQTFSGKNKVSRKAIKPILKLRDKLNGLAFVDQGIAPVVQRLDAGLMQIPRQGSLEGEALAQLMERVLLLCSVEQMQRCAKGLAVVTEPVKRPVNKATQNAEVQENPEDSQTVVAPAEEVPVAATFYF